MACYLVTGAAGFIGSRVAELLLAQGHAVAGVDNMNDAYDVRLKQWRLAQLEGRPGFSFHRLDVSDREALGPLFGGHRFEAVINLAARAGVRQSVENPWVYYQANVTGTLNLLESCLRHGVGKFVLASTSSLYGRDNPMPWREDADTSRPLSPYAASKKAAETLCHSYHYLHGLDVTVFRYFTVYGPAGRPDMVMFRFTQWIAEGRRVRLNGDGSQSRGFTYLDDIARGTILGLKPLGYEIVNLGGHQVINMNVMTAMLEERLGRKARVERYPLDPADMLSNWADVEKARRLLSWEPRVSIEEGMTCLTDWYRAERAWASQIRTE